MTDKPESQSQPERSIEEVSQILANTDGILGAAGHTIDDPASREILRQQAAGEITGEEARAQLRAEFGI